MFDALLAVTIIVGTALFVWVLFLVGYRVRRLLAGRNVDGQLDDIACYLTDCELDPSPASDELWRQYIDARHALMAGDYPLAGLAAAEIETQIKEIG